MGFFCVSGFKVSIKSAIFCGLKISAEKKQQTNKQMAK